MASLILKPKSSIVPPSRNVFRVVKIPVKPFPKAEPNKAQSMPFMVAMNFVFRPSPKPTQSRVSTKP